MSPATLKLCALLDKMIAHRVTYLLKLSFPLLCGTALTRRLMILLFELSLTLDQLKRESERARERERERERERWMSKLGMHRIFGHRKCSAENGPKLHFRPKDFYHRNNTAEMLWWRKQKPRPARACLKQHVCGVDVFQNIWERLTDICKGFLHVGFNVSPEIQTFRSLRWIWEERGTEKENASEHAVCGGRFWRGKEVSQRWCQGKGHYTKDYAIHCLRWSAFSVVEYVGFRRLIEHIEPRYVMPSRQHFSEVCFLSCLMLLQRTSWCICCC